MTTPKPSGVKTGLRRLAREIALRALFHYEVSDNLSPADAFTLFRESFGPDVEDEDVLGCDLKTFNRARPFVERLFFGVIESQEELDRLLTEASDNWRLSRMNRVDRNVMRLALFEMLYMDDIPPKVSINEAIDLGKAFGAEESGAFINGILDRVHRQLDQRAAEAAAEASTEVAPEEAAE